MTLRYSPPEVRLTDEELDLQTRERIKANPDRKIDTIMWVRAQRYPEFGLKEGWDYVKERE